MKFDVSGVGTPFSVATPVVVIEVPCQDHEPCGYVHRQATGTGHITCSCGYSEPWSSPEESVRLRLEHMISHGVVITEDAT